jgi:hypothetical protein
MSILEAVGQYLEDQGFGVQGTNIWLSRMLPDPDVSVAVYEYAGRPPIETMKAGLAIEQPSLQVVVRAGRDDYPTARDKAEAIRQSLCLVTDQTLSGLRVLRIMPRSSVNPIGLDDKDRPMLSVDYEVQIA